MNGILKVTVYLLALFTLIRAHGRLLEPPSRASMWRLGFANPRNYNDNQLFCGGLTTQHEVNGGLCGVCGDVYTPNGTGDHVAGGLYANGIIGRMYKVGQVMDVIVEVTANHLGWMEFQICPNNDPTKKAIESCMSPLVPVGAETSIIPVSAQMVGPLYIKLMLPESLECVQCVLRWKYVAVRVDGGGRGCDLTASTCTIPEHKTLKTAGTQRVKLIGCQLRKGNSWGVDKASGQACQGCGNQETFFSCADVTIGNKQPWWDSVKGIGQHTSTPAPIVAVPYAMDADNEIWPKQSEAYPAEQQAIKDWGSDNYEKYAHLYYSTVDVVTLPTTTKSSMQNKAMDSVPYESSVVKDRSSVSTVKPTTTTTEPLTSSTTTTTRPSTPALIRKTLADFDLGSFFENRVTAKPVEKVTLRPIKPFGSFNFSSLSQEYGAGVTRTPNIIRPANPPKIKKIAPKKEEKAKESLIESVVKGKISWIDMVRMMQSTTTTTTTTTTTLPPPTTTTTEQSTTTTPLVTTTASPIASKLIEMDILHREKLMTILSRSASSADSPASVPYLSPILQSAKKDSQTVDILSEELMSEAGDGILGDGCTVLVIGQENGEDTYLAVCDNQLQ